MNIWEPKTPGIFWATLGMLQDCFTFLPFTVLRMEVHILLPQMQFCTVLPSQGTLAGKDWAVCLLNHPVIVNIIISILHELMGMRWHSG